MKRRLFPLLLAALLLAAPVCAQAVTLTELRAQAPESVRFDIGGETFEVPVVLPEGDALSILVCLSQQFNWDTVKDKSALHDPDSVANAGKCFACLKEAKKNLIYGKTDATARYPLPMGSTPPENDMTLEEAVAFIMDYNEQFSGDPNVDLRVHYAAAMSGLCKMKSGKNVDEATGRTTRMPLPDPKQPVKGREKGLWMLEMCQYMNGVRILQDYRMRYGEPTRNEAHIMDEDTFSIWMQYLQQGEPLLSDAPLAAWETIERSIRELIAQDKIKSLYQIELGYGIQMLQEDLEWYKPACESGELQELKARDAAKTKLRFVLVPTWELKGYCVTEYNEERFSQSKAPSREAVLMNWFGARHFPEQEYTPMRLDAETGAWIRERERYYDAGKNTQ